MAKIPDGVLGALIGKIGPVSGYLRNGENILRTARTRSDRKITPARTAQRAKIKVCNDFTKAFSGTGFFCKTFPAYGNNGTGYNRATSAIMNLAITGTFPDTVINYKDVLVSKGPLPPAENIAASVNNEAHILFTWLDNSGKGTAKTSDKVILVAYCSELKQAIFSIGNASRIQGQAILDTNLLKGYTAETWVGFLSNDEKNVSDSVYCKRIEL